jgi:O-antigen/teichoic acid export membrane protein
MHKTLGIVALQNIAMNVALIPSYGATGAAVSAAVSGLLLGALSIRQATLALRHVRIVRVFAGPAAGAAAMACAIFAVKGSLFAELAVGGVAYAVIALIVERVVFPEEVAMIFASFRIRAKNA